MQLKIVCLLLSLIIFHNVSAMQSHQQPGLLFGLKHRIAFACRSMGQLLSTCKEKVRNVFTSIWDNRYQLALVSADIMYSEYTEPSGQKDQAPKSISSKARLGQGFMHVGIYSWAGLRASSYVDYDDEQGLVRRCYGSDDPHRFNELMAPRADQFHIDPRIVEEQALQKIDKRRFFHSFFQELFSDIFHAALIHCVLHKTNIPLISHAGSSLFRRITYRFSHVGMKQAISHYLVGPSMCFVESAHQDGIRTTIYRLLRGARVQQA